MRKLHLLFVAALLCNDWVVAQETDAGGSTTKTPVSRYAEPLTTVLKKIHQQYNINCLYEESGKRQVYRSYQTDAERKRS